MTYQHFSVEEREKIQEGLWAKKSYRAIAREVGRSVSSVSREIRRNLPPEVRRYTPRLAHARALRQRKSRGRKDRLKNPFIRAYVSERLKERHWSPEQIAGRLSSDYPGHAISHEAIYQFVYASVRPSDALPRSGREDLRPFLKRRHRIRANRHGRRAWRLMQPHGPSIEDRPPAVAARTRFGDWEGDTVASCAHKPGINTLVERRTGYVCITKLAGRSARDTADAVTGRLGVFPARLRRTLTLDNGSENRDWKGVARATGVRCFFAHPYHSWERGTNENTNGLIRHYFPKKTDFTMISAEELSRVERELNHRPRKRLGWKTPQEAMSVALQG